MVFENDLQALKFAKDKLKEKRVNWVIEAREYNSLLLALVDGKDFQKQLAKIEHIELNDNKFKARKKYSKSIKDLNERLLNPLQNVFSATGGSIEINIDNENQSALVAKTLNTCRGNKSLRKFMSSVWNHISITDPQGLIMVESTKDGEKAYPTYKSIQDIAYYDSYGQNVSFVLFEPVEMYGKKVVRLIDAKKDYYFVGQDITNLEYSEELSYSHIFGKCPAIINSDLEETGSNKRLSFIDNILEIENEYLRDQSILTLVKFLNGFKNLVRPRIVCTDCHGLGKKGDKACGSCEGHGFMINRDITDEIIIPIDLEAENQNIPDAASLTSYFGLDVETWNQYRGELKVLEVLMYEALWGTHITTQENQTATAKFIDTQPVINKLNKYADNAEYIETELANLIAKHAIPTLSREEQYVNINYGRRYIIDPPDAILEQYNKARKDGINVTMLDRLYNEYLTSKYKGDDTQLRTMLIKSRVEPFLHYTTKEVFDLFGAKQAAKKVMFRDWWEQYDEKERTNETKAKESFNQFYTQNINDYVTDESMPTT